MTPAVVNYVSTHRSPEGFVSYIHEPGTSSAIAMGRGETREESEKAAWDAALVEIGSTRRLVTEGGTK